MAKCDLIYSCFFFLGVLPWPRPWQNTVARPPLQMPISSSCATAEGREYLRTRWWYLITIDWAQLGDAIFIVFKRSSYLVQIDKRNYKRNQHFHLRSSSQHIVRCWRTFSWTFNRMGKRWSWYCFPISEQRTSVNLWSSFTPEKWSEFFNHIHVTPFQIEGNK